MDDVNESFKRLNKAIIQCNKVIRNVLIDAFQQVKVPVKWRPNRRISYKAKYWKIVEDHKLIIGLMVSDFGSNEHCYYSKMDR